MAYHGEEEALRAGRNSLAVWAITCVVLLILGILLPTAPSLAQKRLLLRSLLALRLPPALQIPKGPSLRKEHYSLLEPPLPV